MLCVLRCPSSTISSKDISLTTVWILIKLGRNDPYMGLFKNCPNGSSPQAKIDFQDENLKIFYSETTRPRALIFGM